MNVVGIGSPWLSAVSAGSDNGPGNHGGLEEAAQKFEALLVTQLLRSARQGAAGEGEADKASASLMETGEERLAEVLTTQGGLGLAKLIIERMGSNFEAPTSADQPIRNTGG
jgi:Rod binding domain-containing protein